MTYVDHRQSGLDELVTEEVTPQPLRAVPEAATRPPGRRRGWWSPLALFLLTDVTALGLAGLLSGARSSFLLVSVVAIVASLRATNLYRPVALPTALSHAGSMAMAACAGSLVAASLTGTTSGEGMRLVLLAAPALFVGRAIAYAHERRSTMRHPERAIVVGTGHDGQQLVSRLLDHPEYGIVPVGFVDDVPIALDPKLPVGVLGQLDDLATLVQETAASRVFLDAGSVSEPELLEVLDRASNLGVEISVLPSLAQHLSTAIAVEGVAGTTVLSYRPSRSYGISWAAKRAVDIVGALVMLIASAPVWLVTAIAIKLDSAGPVLYRQTRVGRDGRDFTIYKFRSMELDADARKTLLIDLNEASGPFFKMRSDPRITRVGRTIRRFSIDEIPQVLNVLRGDMSLVGPRPALASEVAAYPDWFRRRLSVRPGLTGLWQVSGRFLIPFAEAARLDVYYVDHWSLAMDVRILARTPWVVLSGRGAR